MRDRLRLLTRLRNRYVISFDLLGLATIPSVALILRIGDVNIIHPFGQALLLYTIIMLCAKTCVFQLSGLYSGLWMYMSVHEIVSVLRAAALGAGVEWVVFFAILIPFGLLPGWMPRSVPIISSMLTAGWILGSRLGIRMLFARVNRTERALRLRPVLIAGAGAAGALTAKELQNNMHLGLEPIGFVDDDPLKIGKRIHGFPVLGPLRDIPALVRERTVSEVIIALPNVSGTIVREVVQLCKQAKVRSRTIPALYDIVRGKARIGDVRNVQLEDLLRRGEVETNTAPVFAMLEGARVLITGAGGSIGSELCREIKASHPAEMILLGHGESSIFQIMKELEESPVSGMNVSPVIADIRDQSRMDTVFRTFRPDVVFHAGAHKHVQLMQENIPEAVTNNVLGTQTLVQLADQYDVRRFVMMSSDKAVNPTSVMGVTKRIAELIVQDAAQRSGKAFVAVRFGNVLGSRGSEVPGFERQIVLGGPVAVTHPEVTRYFMTIPEATRLVLQAAMVGKGGEVFVLDMGEQIKVIDIARDLIRLSGHTEEEIDIVITGLSAGEKMHEELFYDAERAEPTAHAEIMVSKSTCALDLLSQGANGNGGRQKNPHDSHLQTTVTALIEAAQQGRVHDVVAAFHRLVPQYRSPFGPGMEPVTPQPASYNDEERG